MHKVNMEVIKPWITKKVTDLLSLEDDVLINYVFSLLEEKVWLIKMLIAFHVRSAPHFTPLAFIRTFYTLTWMFSPQPTFNTITLCHTYLI